MAGRAGDVAGLGVDVEVVGREAAGDGLPQGRGLDHEGVAVGFEGFAEFAGSVGGVTEDGQVLVLVGEEVLGDGGLVVAGSAAGGESDLGEQSRLGLERGMRTEALLVAGPVLVDVPGLGINRGNHAVGCGPPGDAPASVTAVGLLGRFDVLACDQGQQAGRVRGLLAEFLFGQVAQQPQCVTDEGVHQVRPGLPVVPGDPRFARVAVVVGGALHGRGRSGAGDLTDHRPHGGDQLGDGVLGGHRVIEDGGVQCPPVLSLQHAGGLHDLAHRLEDPVRASRAGQTTAEVGQQRRIERHIVQAEPARGLPPQVTA